jgi:hypothetical protein
LSITRNVLNKSRISLFSTKFFFKRLEDYNTHDLKLIKKEIMILNENRKITKFYFFVLPKKKKIL